MCLGTTDKKYLQQSQSSRISLLRMVKLYNAARKIPSKDQETAVTFQPITHLGSLSAVNQSCKKNGNRVNDDDLLFCQPNICVGVVLLPSDFVPSDRDIICGRAKKNFYHAGNEYFRQVVAANVRRYLAAKTKVDKGSVIRSIIYEVQGDSPQRQFVREDPRTGGWFEVDESTAREKVGATIRSIVRKAGGEEALLSQLCRLDNTDVTAVDSSPSSGEALVEWMPPCVISDMVPQPKGSDVGDQITSVDEIQESARLKSTGLDLQEAEIDCLTDTTNAKQPWKLQSNDEAESSKESPSDDKPMKGKCDRDSAELLGQDDSLSSKQSSSEVSSEEINHL